MIPAMGRPKTVNIHEAKTHFSELLKRVERGDEVIIERVGRPTARISALAPPKLPDRVPGTGKGLFTMTEDFDAPLPSEIQRFFDGEE
jgi:prevent-host-death family protein